MHSQIFSKRILAKGVLFIFSCLCFFSVFSQVDPGLPAPLSKEQVVVHTGYTLSYNETYEQANWVAYELTSSEAIGLYKRYNRFVPDDKVTTGTADNIDYAHSGFDRGHLAPAADMGWSEQSMRESFYYSNMSPQLPAFNRGIWKRLEIFVRSYALAHHSLYIVTGPVLMPGLSFIGPHQVAVPAFFYKVLLDTTHSPGIGIGFIVPNKGSSMPLEKYAVSIDEVERMTGIDFFPSLTDDTEVLIESKFDLNKWFSNN